MSAVSYKCPNCGGELKFDPKTQKYKCEYCVSAFDNIEGMQTKGADKTSEYSCPSCGAEIMTDAVTASLTCYYCHNPVVLSGRLSGTYLPDQIIPFKIGEKEAKERFLNDVQKKKFVPKAFFKKEQMDQFYGVYFPYWIYSCSMKGELTATGTKVRSWVAGNMEHTERKFYQVERNGYVHLEDLTKYALRKDNHLLAEGIQPYDLKQAKDFQMSYLSGFLAEKRDIERAELASEIEAEVKEYGEKILKETIQGYAGVSMNSCRLQKEEDKWSYILLPIWTLTYRGANNKLYYYSMNGQTGKVYGELPVNNKKIWLTGILLGILTGLICLLGGYLY